MISTAIQQLVNYGLDTGLILPDDEIYIRNQLLMTMQLDSFTEPEGDVCYADLESILKTLVDDAAARGVCDGSPTARDLFDTRLMGVLTPRPSIVRANFEERYETDGPQAATVITVVRMPAAQILLFQINRLQRPATSAISTASSHLLTGTAVFSFSSASTMFAWISTPYIWVFRCTAT